MLIGDYFKNIDIKYKSYYFSGLSFSSVTCKKDNIFFAINGSEIDGNNFIDQAIKNGARIIVSNKRFNNINKNILYIKSDNVRKLLAETA